MAVPTPGGPGYVSDGGLETDLIHHHGVDLPEFAAFPLVLDEPGRARLIRYYGVLADIARRVGAPAFFETPTWRASADWGARLGYDAVALDHVNRAAVDLLRGIAAQVGPGQSVVAGVIGPRGDGYVAGDGGEDDEFATYHRPQLKSFAAAGADLAIAYTLTGPAEATGIVRAANATGIPVAISFTVETDGRLPDGTSLRAAVEQVAAEGDVLYFGVNCAHPTHIRAGLDPGEWRSRIGSLLPNASTKSHAELDGSDELDEGDPAALAADMAALRRELPGVSVVGGCCGTDARHVAAMWDV